MPSPAATTVIVGMSGGVDSAVAALRLLDAGYRVQGLHMTNWDADDEYCEAARDYQDARAVCQDLGIPLHHVNFAAEYRARVFADFLEEYRSGRTPNPDIACNRQIKFGECLRYARRLGADFLATGHYARVRDSAAGRRLLRGADPAKDQSYFLHAVRPEALRQVMFPLGELHKADVRRMANERGLPNHDRKDSTGICFIGERPFREFLQRYIDSPPGPIETPEGDVIGRHHGLAYYTLGQRQGLGIGGLRDYSDEPWYVAARDPARNVLVVTQGRDHPLLHTTELTATDVTWLGEPPLPGMRCGAKTRYRQADTPCTVEPAGDRLGVRFEQPAWAVTPGQYVVLYDGEVCLGGGVIATTRGPEQAAGISVRKTA